MNNINGLSSGVRVLRRAEIGHQGLRSVAAVPDANGINGHPSDARIGGRGTPGIKTKRKRVGFGDVLPRRYFLSQLRLEKLRTDRTSAPLSIALFHFDAERRGSAGRIDDLLKSITDVKRETDVVGFLGEDSIAVLLPDTNEQGAKTVTERILAEVSVPPVSTVTVSYPDQLIEKLILESQDLPDFSPMARDEFDGKIRSGYRLKRLIDILGAIVALLLFSPVMLVAAMAVALTSPGPVIFKQLRLGKGGAPFVFYKFRSMFCDSDDRVHREYVEKLINGNLADINQGTAEKPVYKLKSDPRVTPVGRFIRKTHIDELPQLFNVLKGDMSLVGPRPPLPYEVEKYKSWHLRRILETRPGVTGLWQVEGHNSTSFDDMVRIDLRYIRSCSFLLDVSVLFRTVGLVLSRITA